MTRIQKQFKSGIICYRTAVALMALLVVLQGMTVVAVAQEQTGRSLFSHNCATCHGQTGSPTAVGKSLNAPDLTSAPVQGQGDAELQQIISGGKGNMPAFKDKLSQAQIDSLVAYIHKFSKSHK